MKFVYDKKTLMKIIETGKITNLYRYVNNNLRTIYIEYQYGRLPLVKIYILSKRKAFETSVESVANVGLFNVCTDEKNVGMKLHITDNNV